MMSSSGDDNEGRTVGAADHHHLFSYADGSAEVVVSSSSTPSSLFATESITRTMSTPLGTSVPMTRTKSTPLGAMSYAMKRVLSRDDRGSRQQHHHHHADTVVSEQESERLVRVRPQTDELGVETELDYENTTSSSQPSPLVKTKSRLSTDSTIKKVFTRKKKMKEEDGDEMLHGSSGYGLRKINSTPLQGGLENDYGLKRTKTTAGVHEQSSSLLSSSSLLYNDEDQLKHPTSLVRSRLSSLSQVKKVKVGKPDNNNDDDDVSTVEGSIISSSPSTTSDFALQTKKSSRKKRGKYFIMQLMFASLMIGALVAGLGVSSLLKPADNGHDDVSNTVVAKGNEEVVVEVLQPGDATVGESTSLNVVGSTLPDDDEDMNSDDGDNVIVEDEQIVIEDQVNEDNSLSSKIDATPDEVIAIEELFLEVSENDGDEEESLPNDSKFSETAVDDVDLADEETVVEAVTDVEVQSTSVTTISSPPPQDDIATTEEILSEDTITTFYVMADAPYTDEERYNLMPKYIAELDPDEGEFVVHLGDLQYAKVDACREGAYDEAKQIMKKSQVPAFILPGDNDINDCNSMEHGEAMWRKYLATFDKRWDHGFDVTRWGDLDESFAFIHKQVLFLGLNMVGGSPSSNTEKSNRHQKHLERISSIVNEKSDTFKVVVLLAHAEPAEYHKDFWAGDSGFILIMKEMDKPTIYFHGDWHAYYEREAEFGVTNFMRISTDGESSAPPLLVTIDVSKDNPIKFDRRSSDLEVACCSEGWPRYDGKVVNTPRPDRR